jgi:phage terminase large subunit-like protein
VALYCLTCEGEVGPEIYVGATTGAQALKVFEPAQKMANKSADLCEAFALKVWAKAITCADNSGFIQTVNSKGSTNDGHNPHVAILDELHAHKDRALFDVMKSGMGARRNPLMWIITTAGFNTNGVCYEQRLYVGKVLAGVLQADHVFAIIFTLDEGDDPYDEKNWPKANPMIGITPSWASMRQDAADARASPSAEGNFFTKNLNRWLNAAAAWLNITSWKACTDEKLEWEGLRRPGLPDRGGPGRQGRHHRPGAGRLPGLAHEARRAAADLQADVLVARRGPPGSHPCGGKGPGALSLLGGPRAPAADPGRLVDHNTVEAVVRDWKARYGARRATFDQFAAALGMASKLNEDFGEGDEPFAQVLHKNAKSVTDPAKELERRVKAGPWALAHDGNPVMTWMASNVVVTRKVDETIIPKKETPMSPNKIDGIDALINAIQPAVMPEEAAPKFEYTGL